MTGGALRRRRTGLLLERSCTALALLLVASCSSRDCPDIACNSGVVVTVTSSAWTAGDYELRVEVGGTVVSCTFGVGTGAEGPKCTDGMLWIELPPAASSARFRLMRTPVTVALSVLRDGATRAESVVTPNYDDVTPYPRDCGPACLEAKAEIALN